MSFQTFEGDTRDVNLRELWSAPGVVYAHNVELLHEHRRHCVTSPCASTVNIYIYRRLRPTRSGTCPKQLHPSETACSVFQAKSASNRRWTSYNDVS